MNDSTLHKQFLDELSMILREGKKKCDKMPHPRRRQSEHKLYERLEFLQQTLLSPLATMDADRRFNFVLTQLMH